MQVAVVWFLCLFSVHCTELDTLAFIRTQQQELKAMFDHGFDAYITYAFPADVLHPLTCTPGYRPSLPVSSQDTLLGNFSLTLIDSLDSLLLFNRPSDFQTYSWYLSSSLSFDLDTDVSVFETGIRVLGGLLSAYILGKDANFDVVIATSRLVY